MLRFMQAAALWRLSSQGLRSSMYMWIMTSPGTTLILIYLGLLLHLLNLLPLLLQHLTITTRAMQVILLLDNLITLPLNIQCLACLLWEPKLPLMLSSLCMAWRTPWWMLIGCLTSSVCLAMLARYAVKLLLFFFYLLINYV